MLRFPPAPLDCAAAYGGTLAAIVVGGAEPALLVAWWDAEGADSFESEARRRWEISTLTVLMARAVKADVPARTIVSSYPEILLPFSVQSFEGTVGVIEGCSLKRTY